MQSIPTIPLSKIGVPSFSDMSYEFIQLVHLRESGYDETIYQKRKKSYIPQPNQQSCSKCFFEIQEDGNCFFCDGDIVKIILCQITKR